MGSDELTTDQLKTLLEQHEPIRLYLLRLKMRCWKTLSHDDQLTRQVDTLDKASYEYRRMLESLIAARRGYFEPGTGKLIPGKDDPK